MTETECVILCEGFYDRAFWAGWLLHMGCTDLREHAKDPWGTAVSGGQYAYLTPGKLFVRVQPCKGGGNVLRVAQNRLRGRATHLLSRLILNIDPDTDSASSTATKTGMRASDVLDAVRGVAPDARLLPNQTIEVDGGATHIHLIRWEVAVSPNPPGVPTQNTLERLVSAAITEAYPGRGDAVESWLKARPEPPEPCPKEHAWSYFAGWYADGGCDFFYKRQWEDKRVRERLRAHLTAAGAWEVVEEIAR